MRFQLFLCSPLSSQSFAALPSSRGHHTNIKSLWKGTHAHVSVSGTHLAQIHLQWQLIPRQQALCRSNQDAETTSDQLCHRALTFWLTYQNLHFCLQLLQQSLPEQMDFIHSDYQRTVSVYQGV